MNVLGLCYQSTLRCLRDQCEYFEWGSVSVIVSSLALPDSSCTSSWSRLGGEIGVVIYVSYVTGTASGIGIGVAVPASGVRLTLRLRLVHSLPLDETKSITLAGECNVDPGVLSNLKGVSPAKVSCTRLVPVSGVRLALCCSCRCKIWLRIARVVRATLSYSADEEYAAEVLLELSSGLWRFIPCCLLFPCVAPRFLFPFLATDVSVVCTILNF